MLFLQLLLEKANTTISELNAEIARHMETISQLEKSIQDYQSECREHESVRRKLHNTIQELKVVTLISHKIISSCVLTVTIKKSVECTC